MQEPGSLPRARQDGLLEETVGEELLLYDQNSHTAHCLSPVAACVWRHCDGERDIAELARLAGASEDLIAGALHELREKDLLDAEPELVQSAVAGESRRETISRVARYGAAAAAGSMIVSATAATPAMASSGEEVKVCSSVLNLKKSCCECMNLTCISNSAITNSKMCEEECAKHGGLKTWIREGECK
jgi:hypothetical protein